MSECEELPFKEHKPGQCRANRFNVAGKSVKGKLVAHVPPHQKPLDGPEAVAGQIRDSSVN